MIPLAIPPIPTTLVGVLVLIVGLVILWIIISIPVYFAGKVITDGKAEFGQAMGATLGGGLAYFVVYYGVAYLLGTLIGPSAAIFALILAVIVWVGVYRASFDTDWLRAIGIVIVGWLVLIVLDFFLVHVFGVGFPDFFPF
ncbi:MAG: hypothetical protein OK452_06535 [Thaumarchaeota archaeon]|nr:hypothetical protein [Nitrososphaerota archaeon]